MQAMQAAVSVHKTLDQVKGQQSTAVEKGVFSEQLTQSINEKVKQTEDSIKDDSTSGQVEVDESNQELEQTDATEDEINPDVAFLFRHPFLAAEHLLATQFNQIPVMDDELEQVQGEEQIKTDSFQLQNTASNLEGLMRQTETVLLEEDKQNLPAPTDGEQELLEAGTKSLFSPTLQKMDQSGEEAVSDQDKQLIPSVSNENLKEQTHVVQDLPKDDVQETASLKDGSAVDSKKGSLNTSQSNPIDSQFVMEEPDEVRQPQAIESKQIDISDLDVQSDFRLKVTAAKTNEIPMPQQPAMQREIPIPVALISESQSANQQVLSQAISEVILDQVTTLKDGQQTIARLSLTPETLGHIKIELKMVDQKLQTTIVVESSETKALLDSSVQQLTTSLAQKNIQLQEMSIQLNLPQETNFTFAESHSQQNKQQQDNNQSAMYFGSVEDLKPQPVNEENNSTAGRVSILA
ncbi:flagellar hook-length control protein FliK [Desemzia sp. RIT804]|uniref:flagellar hook-length control protein FliK n=1 Tax=Desemzia sp. RIT 804 TaxID=2810209 RepID=UPI00194F5A7A|nr:flagellar hook-length control protein FliK [Desemzia sp. RIT 804]MBM6614695.1 flagellar hook-length control protein FliK [Desemzia sp. RIT 804]